MCLCVCVPSIAVEQNAMHFLPYNTYIYLLTVSMASRPALTGSSAEGSGSHKAAMKVSAGSDLLGGLKSSSELMNYPEFTELSALQLQD